MKSLQKDVDIVFVRETTEGLARAGTVIADAKHLTSDLGGTASTTQMGEAVTLAIAAV